MAREVCRCPFCGFQKDDEYAIQLHIEEHHTEDSPFTITNAAPTLTPVSSPASHARSTPGGGDWIKCTRPGCGEYMLVRDIQEHLDLHAAIDASGEDRNHDKADERRGPISKGQVHDPDRRVGTNGGSRHASNYSTPSASSSEEGASRSSSRTSRKSTQRSRWEGRSNGTPAKTAPSRSSGTSSSRSLLDYFSGSSAHGRPPLPPRPPRRIEEPREPGRLGTKELGPHASEKVMPIDVRRGLLNDALPRQVNRIARDGRIIKETFIENETTGLIPVLADLCSRSRGTTTAYFSHPCVRHIHKLRVEGNFCGYWNIQMMCSFLASNAGNSALLPNVLEIQDAIEQAWDNGICAYSRIETGGIRGTRKWIGTHDALAYFTQKEVSMQALSFKDEDEEQPAILSLLDHLEAYYMSGLDGAETRGCAHITNLPPVYFQRAGHSMTIAGLERRKDGHRNLIIFDPSFGTMRSMDQILDGKRTTAEPHTLLKPYRHSDESLSRWKEFEILIPQRKKDTAAR